MKATIDNVEAISEMVKTSKHTELLLPVIPEINPSLVSATVVIEPDRIYKLAIPPVLSLQPSVNPDVISHVDILFWFN